MAMVGWTSTYDLSFLHAPVGKPPRPPRKAKASGNTARAGAVVIDFDKAKAKIAGKASKETKAAVARIIAVAKEKKARRAQKAQRKALGKAHRTAKSGWRRPH